MFYVLFLLIFLNSEYLLSNREFVFLPQQHSYSLLEPVFERIAEYYGEHPEATDEELGSALQEGRGKGLLQEFLNVRNSQMFLLNFFSKEELPEIIIFDEASQSDRIGRKLPLSDGTIFSPLAELSSSCSNISEWITAINESPPLQLEVAQWGFQNALRLGGFMNDSQFPVAEAALRRDDFLIARLKSQLKQAMVSVVEPSKLTELRVKLQKLNRLDAHFTELVREVEVLARIYRSELTHKKIFLVYGRGHTEGFQKIALSVGMSVSIPSEFENSYGYDSYTLTIESAELVSYFQEALQLLERYVTISHFLRKPEYYKEFKEDFQTIINEQVKRSTLRAARAGASCRVTCRAYWEVGQGLLEAAHCFSVY